LSSVSSELVVNPGLSFKRKPSDIATSDFRAFFAKTRQKTLKLDRIRMDFRKNSSTECMLLEPVSALDAPKSGEIGILKDPVSGV
jgi:hypothetical protein